MIPGIDISEWQGHVDFNAVKASGVKFVLIRAGYGRSASQVDHYFAEHYAQAKAAGLQVGAYWYSYAVSPADAANEARACLTVLGNRHFDYPIYFDLEEKWQFANGRNFCDSLVKASVAFWNRMVAMRVYIFLVHHCKITSLPLLLSVMQSG
ncbi:GH25 family lysozyme [Lactobacillus gasseri]|uniref:GH25 family lysozyme n=1 Tax=Lactobacillus sp. JCM 1131 TaxID=3153753 RepID=A0AAU7G8H5_9LACO